MAGRRKSVGPVNYHELPRKRLQSLCKKYGFPANKTNVAMADALTAFLNAPERLASGIIDSPAISSKSSYLSSSYVEESPMMTPGVDSLPTISESRQEVFKGLRITNLPEIMEIENSPDKVAQETVNNSDEMHTSEVTYTMADTSATVESPHHEKEMEVSENDRIIDDSAVSEGSKCDMEATEMEHSEILETVNDRSRGNGNPQLESDLKGMECSEIIDTMIDDFRESAGPLSDSEGKEMDYTENSQTLPDESSRSEGLVSVRGAKNLECEERFQMDAEGTSERENKEKCVSPSDDRTEAFVPNAEVMIEVPLPVSEELKQALDRSLDELAGTVEVTTISEFRAGTPARNSELENSMIASLEEVREGVKRESATERETDSVRLDSSSDHATETFLSVPKQSAESGEAVDSTPLPLSVMPHASLSDLSVSNKDGVRLVVDLNNRGFPVLDMLESDGDIKISSHTSEAMKNRAGSREPLDQGPGFAARTQDEVFGPFKCLNPAALSPKVRRSLGIYAPKLTFSSPPKCRAPSLTENESEFSFDVPLDAPVVSPVALAPPKVTELALVVNTKNNTGSTFDENFPIEAGTTYVSYDETSETTKQRAVNEENKDRSESPIAGYVKEIVTLLENMSGEKQKAAASRNDEAPAPSRKDSYKQSPLVRSSRIAADIERAAKLGQAKRSLVLAGKRSLWEPTLSGGVLEEDEPKIVEEGALHNTVLGSITSVGTADKTEEHEHAAVQEVPVLPELPSDVEMTSGDNPLSPQQVQMNIGNNRFVSVASATEGGGIIGGGVSVSNSSSNDRAEATVSGVLVEVQKASAEDAQLDNGLPRVSDKTTVAEIKYVEIPRPLERNVDCGPISELSWIRKATNLPTPKSQKLNEKVKRPASANMRKFELMERAALNSAKNHRTPKKTTSARCETPDAPPTVVSVVSASLESQAPSGYKVEKKEVGFLDIDGTLMKTPDISTTAPLNVRDCNKESGALIAETCSASPKSPAISLDKILRENTASTGKENLCGKENERLRRHQEEYKTPLTGRSKEKALRAAEMNAAILREKILKQRRGIEQEEEQTVNTAIVCKNSLLGRLL